MLSSRGFLSPKEFSRGIKETFREDKANQLKKENLKLIEELYHSESERRRLEIENSNLIERLNSFETSMERREQQKLLIAAKEREKNIALIETLTQDLNYKKRCLEREEQISNQLKAENLELKEFLKKKDRDMELIKKVSDKSLANQMQLLNSQKNIFSAAMKNEFISIAEEFYSEYQNTMMKLKEEIIHKEIKLYNLEQVFKFLLV